MSRQAFLCRRGSKRRGASAPIPAEPEQPEPRQAIHSHVYRVVGTDVHRLRDGGYHRVDVSQCADCGRALHSDWQRRPLTLEEVPADLSCLLLAMQAAAQVVQL